MSTCPNAKTTMSIQATMSTQATMATQDEFIAIPPAELKELQREHENDMDIPAPATTKRASKRPNRLQKGQVVIVYFLRTDGTKGVICRVPGSSNAYLPATHLLGDDSLVQRLMQRVQFNGDEFEQWEGTPNEVPIYARVTKTGYKFVHGKKRQRTTLAEITEAEYENQVHAAEEQVLAIPKGSLQRVTVVRPAFSRGKKNEICGLKVVFDSLYPGVEALIHFTEIEAGLSRVLEVQQGDVLRVRVTRSRAVNGQAQLVVSEKKVSDEFLQAHGVN